MRGDRTFIHDLAVVNYGDHTNSGKHLTRPKETHSGSSRSSRESPAIVALSCILNCTRPSPQPLPQ